MQTLSYKQPVDFKQDDDGASIISAVETLVAPARLGAHVGDNSEYLGDLTRPLQVTLYTCYDRAPPESGRFLKVGFPADESRGTAKANSTMLGPLNQIRKVTALRKRQSVGIPVEELYGGWSYLPDPQNVADVQARKDLEINRKMLHTVWDSEVNEFIDIRERTLLSKVLSTIYLATDVRSPFAVYPKERVISAPSALLDNQTGEAKVEVKWATMFLTSPEPRESSSGTNAMDNGIIIDDSNGKGKRRGSKGQLEEDYWSKHPSLRPGHAETAEEAWARLYRPTEESREMLTRLIIHLESRGAIIQRAAQEPRASMAVPDPQKRPRFMVQGMYPNWLINKVRRHPKRAPFPNDAGDNPLLVRSPMWEAQGTSAGSKIDESPLEPHEVDFMEGWSGTVSADVFAKMQHNYCYAGAGMMAGGFGGC